MNFLKPIVIFLISHSFAVNTFAAGEVNYLNVEDDTVVFSTDADKEQPSPACVSTEDKSYYTASLKNESGRAMYSLVIVALAEKLPLKIESAFDCNDLTGIERAKGISLEPVSIASGSGLGLYKGDGTRIGKIVNALSLSSFYYLPTDGNNILSEFTFDDYLLNATFYFKGENCTGDVFTLFTDPYKSGVVVSNPFHDNGKLYTLTGNSLNSITPKSILYSNGHCGGSALPPGYSFMQASPRNDAVCGTHLCVIKED